MSANADVLRRSELRRSEPRRSEPISSTARETPFSRVDPSRETHRWNPEDFAREQIRGLVRRVFFATGAQPVKQIVFSAVEPNTDLAHICDQVGRALALETPADIAIVGRERRVEPMSRPHFHHARSSAIKTRSTREANNLWRVPGFGACECTENLGTGPYWLSCLAELRNEFEYAVIHGAAAGISSEAEVLGRLADGIILVLEAHSTRRATARKIKQTLEGAQARILGTVLSERRFPIPDRIYQRL
jgi:hypothetical protein